MPAFDPTGLALIYDGFYSGSTAVSVRIPGITVGDTVYLYDEDSLEQLGSGVSTSDDIVIAISPLNSRRIIAFVESFGIGTVGGVDVIPSPDILTGWLTPEPVDEESVPVEIGLYNPGAAHPLTARYDPALANNIPAAYRAAAIELVLEPITFDLTITYRVDVVTDDPMAVVAIGSVKNVRGTYTAVIDGTTTNSKNIFTDKTFNVTITDSQARVATRSVTVNPVTGYMPVPPAPPATSIIEFKSTAEFAAGVYYARADCRADAVGKQLEVSFNGGSTYRDMSGNGGTQWGALEYNILPTPITIVVRVKATPADLITRTIPVPYP